MDQNHEPSLALEDFVPGRVIFFGVGWDAQNAKRRPGVVVERTGDMLTVVKGTSQIKEGEFLGHVVTDFKSVGLRKVTRFVPTTTFRIPVGAVSKLGRMLASEDTEAILASWKQWKDSIQVGTLVWYSFDERGPRLGVVVDRRSQHLTVLRARVGGEGHLLQDTKSARVRPGTVVTAQRTHLEFANIETRAGDLTPEDLTPVLELHSPRR